MSVERQIVAGEKALTTLRADFSREVGQLVSNLRDRHLHTPLKTVAIPPNQELGLFGKAKIYSSVSGDSAVTVVGEEITHTTTDPERNYFTYVDRLWDVFGGSHEFRNDQHDFDKEVSIVVKNLTEVRGIILTNLNLLPNSIKNSQAQITEFVIKAQRESLAGIPRSEFNVYLEPINKRIEKFSGIIGHVMKKGKETEFLVNAKKVMELLVFIDEILKKQQEYSRKVKEIELVGMAVPGQADLTEAMATM